MSDSRYELDGNGRNGRNGKHLSKVMKDDESNDIMSIISEASSCK